MTEKVVFTPPPNLRSVECCGTCKHAQHGYEGVVDCTKYPEWVNTSAGATQIYDGTYQSSICDDFEPDEPLEDSADG